VKETIRQKSGFFEEEDKRMEEEESESVNISIQLLFAENSCSE